MQYIKSRGFYAELDDYQLVLACQQKSEAAFNALYKRYALYVRGALRRMAPDLAQSHDDFVQEVFIRVWKSIDKLRDPRAFRSWLNQLIRHLFYDELRKRPKEMVISIDEPLKSTDGDEDGAVRDIPDSKAQPDEALELAEIIVYVNAALEQLPQHSKKVILMREFYGLSYEEIAQRTKSELGTVKSRIARARCKMQTHLKILNCA